MEKNEKVFTAPEMEVVRFEVMDIIVSSTDIEQGDDAND